MSGRRQIVVRQGEAGTAHAVFDHGSWYCGRHPDSGFDVARPISCPACLLESAGARVLDEVLALVEPVDADPLADPVLLAAVVGEAAAEAIGRAVRHERGKLD